MRRVLLETVIAPDRPEQKVTITGIFDNEQEKFFIYSEGLWGRTGYARKTYAEFIQAYATEVLNRMADDVYYAVSVEVKPNDDETIKRRAERRGYNL